MDYSELFSGEEIWLDESADPGWISPFLKVLHTVEMETQRDLDPLESPLKNLVVDTDKGLEAVWGIERGWSAFSVMLQNIAELLSYGTGLVGSDLMEIEQLVVRDEKTWKVTSTHYRVLWKGEEVEGI